MTKTEAMQDAARPAGVDAMTDWTVHQGDCLEVLKGMADESVNCVVTSPPYFGLRDYGVDGQIGLEPTPQEFVAKMVEVFRECRRVLRKDGTCWVNMGDSYSQSGKWGGHSGNKNYTSALGGIQRCKRFTDAKPKDLLGIPWRLAFALQDDGWYLRSDIIWSKPNPMPESVTDRPTKAHEYIFLLTKSAKYWYDASAIRTLLSDASLMRPEICEFGPRVDVGYPSGKPNRRRADRKMPDGWDTGPGAHGSFHRNGREKGRKSRTVREGVDTKGGGQGNGTMVYPLDTANARTVWTIPTKGYAKAHFATFPPEIPKRCILAGCPEGGTVLDPFAGSGTTLAVALELGRNAVGIELNPAYVELIRERMLGVTPGMVLV